MSKSAGLGRPSLPARERKRVRLQVSVTDDEARAVRKRGVVSCVIRNALKNQGVI